MNYRKYLNSAALKADPLCGISTYKDTLNLATGVCTRQIKKLVLDGTEDWQYLTNGAAYLATITDYSKAEGNISKCSHFVTNNSVQSASEAGQGISFYNAVAANYRLYLKDSTLFTTVDTLKSWLAAQYAAGTPATIWYVLATATTETISLPSGLSGTLEGSLTQSGTPTPSAPIYPTAVTGEGWYNINTYKRSVLVWNTDTAYERDSGAWN